MWDLETIKKINNMTPEEFQEWKSKTYRTEFYPGTGEEIKPEEIPAHIKDRFVDPWGKGGENE